MQATTTSYFTTTYHIPPPPRTASPVPETDALVRVVNDSRHAA
eukprot:CAMPEP_0202876136 /NCGR_PEP_ID=MMETSP1391-20130828/28533_1 /ASSEMBLY_ACC=CAM_ASM_000867 /TAXON_ID=1034604 /ORGANISM="Chlamydomonas leiostraca, Strain SAG 11-49" /LENGTH=42 /DNA_ID= /DNA_START= /DNA_END= /DNA_ORIENTATION=